MVLTYWFFNVPKAQFEGALSEIISSSRWSRIGSFLLGVLRLCSLFHIFTEVMNTAKRWTNEGLAFMAMIEHPPVGTEESSQGDVCGLWISQTCR